MRSHRGLVLGLLALGTVNAGLRAPKTDIEEAKEDNEGNRFYPPDEEEPPSKKPKTGDKRSPPEPLSVIVQDDVDMVSSEPQPQRQRVGDIVQPKEQSQTQLDVLMADASVEDDDNQINSYRRQAQSCDKWHENWSALADNTKCGEGNRYNEDAKDKVCDGDADCMEKCCLPELTCFQWHGLKSALAYDDHHMCGEGKRYYEKAATRRCLHDADCKDECCLPTVLTKTAQKLPNALLQHIMAHLPLRKWKSKDFFFRPRMWKTKKDVFKHEDWDRFLSANLHQRMLLSKDYLIDHLIRFLKHENSARSSILPDSSLEQYWQHPPQAFLDRTLRSSFLSDQREMAEKMRKMMGLTVEDAKAQACADKEKWDHWDHFEDKEDSDNDKDSDKEASCEKKMRSHIENDQLWNDFKKSFAFKHILPSVSSDSVVCQVSVKCERRDGDGNWRGPLAVLKVPDLRKDHLAYNEAVRAEAVEHTRKDFARELYAYQDLGPLEGLVRFYGGSGAPSPWLLLQHLDGESISEWVSAGTERRNEAAVGEVTQKIQAIVSRLLERGYAHRKISDGVRHKHRHVKLQRRNGVLTPVLFDLSEAVAVNFPEDLFPNISFSDFMERRRAHQQEPARALNQQQGGVGGDRLPTRDVARAALAGPQERPRMLRFGGQGGEGRPLLGGGDGRPVFGGRHDALTPANLRRIAQQSKHDAEAFFADKEAQKAFVKEQSEKDYANAGDMIPQIRRIAEYNRQLQQEQENPHNSDAKKRFYSLLRKKK